MRYGDVCIETLRLCYTNGVEFLDDTGLAEYRADERYSDQLQMMRGAVNRCLADMEARSAVPVKMVELEGGEPFAGIFTAFARPADCVRVERVTAYSEGRYDSSVDYQTDGKRILVEAPHGYWGDVVIRYGLTYRPRVARITADTQDTDEIDLPDELAELIPYFCAGDIDRLEEPARAADMRNRYEAGVMQYVVNREDDGKSDRVIDVMSGGIHNEW